MNEIVPPIINTTAYSEYTRFEPVDADGMVKREEQNRLFRAGKLTTPDFEYPKLRGEDLDATALAFNAAIKDAPSDLERELLEVRRKGVEIARASLYLALAGDANDNLARWAAGQELVKNSESRYGELNPALFWPVLAAKAEVVRNFQPANEHAVMTQERLLGLLDTIPKGTVVKPVIDQELLSKIRPEVMDYLAPILEVLPMEGEFTSDEIKTLGDSVLESMGLAQKGWVAVQNSQTNKFSTARSKKTIIIPNPPSSEGKVFKKSANDLRRLFAHEVGIHAMWEAGNDPEAEEGLGILMECVVSNTSKGVAIKRAEDRYLHYGLAKGMGGKPRNARQVFEITWRLEALQLSKDGIVKPAIEAEAKLSVQAHIDNLFRGTDHKLPGVHYGRAKLYLEGIAVVADYARAHGTEAGWLQRALKDSVANPGN